MRCLTVHQPWAWALIFGPKRIENRSWTTTYRGPLWIHAGSSRSSLGERDHSCLICPPTKTDHRAILGLVDLIDCVPLEQVAHDPLRPGPGVAGGQPAASSHSLPLLGPSAALASTRGASDTVAVRFFLATRANELEASRNAIDGPAPAHGFHPIGFSSARLPIHLPQGRSPAVGNHARVAGRAEVPAVASSIQTGTNEFRKALPMPTPWKSGKQTVRCSAATGQLARCVNDRGKGNGSTVHSATKQRAAMLRS